MHVLIVFLGSVGIVLALIVAIAIIALVTKHVLLPAFEYADDAIEEFKRRWVQKRRRKD